MNEHDGGDGLRRLQEAADAVSNGGDVESIAESWLQYALADAHAATSEHEAEHTALLAQSAFHALLAVKIEARLTDTLAAIAHRVGSVEALLVDHEHQADEVTDRGIAAVRELSDRVVGHERWAERIADEQVGRMRELVERVERIERACPGIEGES